MSSQSLVNVPQNSPPSGEPVKTEIKQSSRVSRHLAQAVQLEESGTTPLIRLTIYLACAACAVFLGWSSLTTVDEVAVAEGEILPIGSIKTVQHLEGGIVEEILVKEGELVEVGQPILKLSPAQALAELEQTRAREMTLLLKSERLRAFVENRKPDFSFAGPQYASLVQDNTSIYQAQIQARDTGRSIIMAQIEQKRADLRQMESQQKSLREQVNALAEEMKIRDQLVAKGLVTRITHLDTKRELARAEGELTRMVGQTVTAREAVSEMENRLIDSQSGLQKQNMDEMGVTIAELAQVQETIARLEDRVTRLIIESPARGYIKGLTVKNQGAVIQPGGLISEIVPVDQEMRVEAKVLPRDVGHLRIGQKVRVKVTTYDFARYGSIMGKLERISASSFLNEKGEPFFKANVSLDKSYVGPTPGHFQVAPGMTVSAEIITGDKTLFQYMLKPIFTQLQQSFHER